ncbi:MAG: hypothetical protein QM703_16885 [Gemmatales bacterium]
MNQIEPTTAGAPPSAMGSIFSCLLHSFVICIGLSLLATILSSIVAYLRGQFPLHDASFGSWAFTMSLYVSFVGSLFGFWLPALLYHATAGKKWALISGAACVAFINAFFWFPEMLNAYHSLG